MLWPCILQVHTWSLSDSPASTPAESAGGKNSVGATSGGSKVGGGRGMGRGREGEQGGRSIVVLVSTVDADEVCR